MSSYWENRFTNEGMIWGENPSNTVYHAIEIFNKNNVKQVLVPGSGYGRHTKALSSSFSVDGIEISQSAINLATQWDSKSTFIQGSVLDETLIHNKKYDAIFCFDVLHLFLEQDRAKLIQNCHNHLNASGIMYFTCFSNEDQHNGIGARIEKGTYEYVAGKYAHFFTEVDLLSHFSKFKVIEHGTTKEILNYNNHQSKDYILRYIVVQKIR
jgi:SAM-dependent methyltransferase